MKDSINKKCHKTLKEMATDTKRHIQEKCSVLGHFCSSHNLQGDFEATQLQQARSCAVPKEHDGHD
jgi:hypothetical protein